MSRGRSHGRRWPATSAPADNPALFGFGDVVCVPAITWIADRYLNVEVTRLVRGRLLYAG